MNSLRDRVGAIKEVFSSEVQQATSAQGAAFLDAVLSCCSELVVAGEAVEAIALLDQAARIAGAPPESWLVRSTLMRARALLAKGDVVEAYGFLRELRPRILHALGAVSPEFVRLRITEGTALWRMNRVTEGLEVLAELRRELLGAPDSALLAACSYTMSSAEMIRGNYVASREFALEAIVSARRSGDRFVEALGLGNLVMLDRHRCRWGPL